MKRMALFGLLVSFVLVSVATACPQTCYEEYNPCDYYEEYDECGCYDDGVSMAHWANLRDECGNIIGVLDEGSSVEILGQCSDNPSRTMVCNPCTGCYGTVASVYIYGGTAYEYENPTEYCGRSYGYAPCREEEYYYEDCSYNPTDELVYDETTPWACDDLEAYYEEYPYCPYETYYDTMDDEYGYCYDDDSYFSFYDEGEVHIDVDIQAQVVYVYQGSTVVLSGSCVSGMAGMMDTPCGQYTLLDKQRGATLVGDDYECSVDYWMPFTESGCGFHDASWRDDFGGDIYQYGGSHGCVNLEEGFVEQMYEICPEGCVVNIH